MGFWLGFWPCLHENNTGNNFSNLASWHSTGAGCSPFFPHVLWESFKCCTAATFLGQQKVSWISFDLICCAQKSFVPISSLSFRHHRTCRPHSSLSQLFRGGLRQSQGWSKTKILQERCVSDWLYTSYRLFLFKSCMFDWILMLFVNQILRNN